MPEGLKTASGEAVDLDGEFARAMAAPEPDEPVAAAPPRKDPEAPYGRKADGSPKAGPGGRPAKAPKPRVAKAPNEAKAAPPGPELEKQRTEGIKGAVQVGSMVTLLMYQRTEDRAFLADTITLNSYAEPLSDAVMQTCAVSPGFAKLVDAVTQVGPYAALATVGISLAAQVAANHGVAAGKMLGASDPADIIAKYEEANGPIESPPANQG